MDQRGKGIESATSFCRSPWKETLPLIFKPDLSLSIFKQILQQANLNLQCVLKMLMGFVLKKWVVHTPRLIARFLATWLLMSDGAQMKK